MTSLRFARVTVSDRASAGVYEDRGGPAIQHEIEAAIQGPHEWEVRVIPDERELIAETLRVLCDELECALVLTTGGTGPAPRDVTPEATRDILERELPGFGEAMRMRSFETVPTAILSRAVAGMRGRSLIINLPGNPKAVGEIVPMLVPAIIEAIDHLRGVRLRAVLT